MSCLRVAGWVGFVFLAVFPELRADDGATEQLLGESRTALDRGRFDEAVALAGQAIVADPKQAEAYLLRARAYVAGRQPAKAVSDFDQVLKLRTEAAGVYNSRGSARFQSGDVAGSIEDFDKFISLRPNQERGHWKRGISYYYAEQFDKGRRQFEAYQTFDDNDVENAVWRYLCMAPDVGVEQARKSLLRIKDDRRVPMRQVFELFAGRITTDDVLAAARAGNPAPEQLNRQLFYAHLYVGLFHEAAGNEELARKHITLASDKHKIGHYMWDVAHVHAERLRKAKQ